MDLIQVDIIGLSTSPSSGGAYALVLDEVEGNRRLPIIIGAFEAQAIALELEKIQPPRPMTHDLLRDMFEAVGAEVIDVVIDELRDGTFFAKIRYMYDGEESQIDARPSDAVALAVRVDAPIFVAPAVLNEAGIPTEEEGAVVEKAQIEDDAPAAPLSRLEKMEQQLDEAIQNENYERAAQLRDQIQQLKETNN